MQLGLSITLKGIGELIQTRHKVPRNQREYAWEEKHIKDFVRDITEAKSEDKPQYFMGTVVVTSSLPIPEVVDGQQRMATTCIFIAAVRDYLIGTGDQNNIRSAKIIEGMYLLAEDARDLETHPHFQLNEIDNQFFREYILEGDPNKKSEKSFQSSIPSHARLMNAYLIAADAVKKIAEAPPAKAREQLNDLITYLKDKVQIILLQASDEASAFVLFETLNDRGITLAISDLLKNFLLGKAQSRIVEVKNKWHEMKVTLESAEAGEDVVTYIRQLWCSENGLVREKDLFHEIKKKVTTSNSAVVMAESLSKNSKNFVELVNPDQTYWSTYGFDAYKSVKALNIINHTQPRPLILAILNNFAVKEVKSAIRLIEAWSFRFSVTKRLGGEGMEREYSNLAMQISKGKISTTKELKAAMKLVPTDQDFKEALSIYPIKKALLARYMLIEIEKLKAGGKNLEYIPNDNPEAVNLEHILPKSYPAKYWTGFDEDEHFKYSTILGNLTLMLSGDNKVASQGSFSDKKKIYQNSEILLTKELAKYSAWTPKEIAKRQSELGDLAVKRWAT